MKKIAVINTNPLTYNMLNGILKEMMPDAQVFNILDDSLLPEAMEKGINSRIIDKMRMYVKCAVISGADVILNQCSSVSEAVDVLRKEIEIPYLKIDEPMAFKAVELGKNITVIATVESTIGPSRKLIEEAAFKLGKTVKINTVLVDGAIELLSEADGVAKHDEMVLNEVKKLSSVSDVIVLAQASMYRISEKAKKIDIEVPVLSSPVLAAEKIKNILLK